MIKPARSERAGRSFCLGTTKLQNSGPKAIHLGLLGLVLALFPLAPSFAQVGSPSTICLPPEEPFVPASDEDFKAYADMVSSDFEHYFKELTAYFSCMDETRQAVFDRARSVSQDHQAFWRRANALGVAEKAAQPPHEAKE